MLLTYFLNYFEIVPAAPILTGITFVFTFHMRCISIVRPLLLLLLLLLSLFQIVVHLCNHSETSIFQATWRYVIIMSTA
jgi:hypothetical protein